MLNTPMNRRRRYNSQAVVGPGRLAGRMFSLCGWLGVSSIVTVSLRLCGSAWAVGRGAARLYFPIRMVPGCTKPLTTTALVEPVKRVCAGAVERGRTSWLVSRDFWNSESA